MPQKSVNMKEEFIKLFSESVLPAIQKQIDSRDEAKKHLDGLEGKLKGIKQKIQEITNEIGMARKEAALPDSHQEPVNRIIELKGQREVLEEIKDEIEGQTLPDSRKELEKEQARLKNAAIIELKKILKKEKKRITNMLKDVLNIVTAYDEAKATFSEMLNLPTTNALVSECELWIEGLNNIDIE